MFVKLYDFLKRFIKENYREIIFLILFFIIINYPLDYNIMISGGTINVDDRVEIVSEYDSNGSFNLAYVTELKGTIPTVLLSNIIPSWTKVKLEEYQINSKETIEDINRRAKIYLEYSTQAATKVAYEKASKDFKVKGYKFFVVYIDEKVNSDIKIGDIILEVEGKKITTMEDYKNIVNEHSIGDYINLTIERNNKQRDVSIEVRDIDGDKLTGISVLQLFDYETTPKIELKFNQNESGSSGGLMLSLSIYDKLIKEDLTKGLDIVGTGTIDFDGNVGKIDGVKYKLKGAVKDKADVFIAPSGENYEECLRLKEKNNYDILILEAKTFSDVLEKLSDLEIDN